MSSKKPIFVVGLGRSGSSIFHEMFSLHPELAWLSSITERYPSWPQLNKLVLNSLSIPVIGSFVREKLAPAECYNFWEHYSKGFRTPCRDLHAQDLTEKSRIQLINAFSQVSTPSRDRLLFKVTGWPRIGFLKALFKDAIFIHIKRDAPSVANSFLAVPWWWGWRGPSNWRWGPLNDYYANLWQAHNESFVALAGIACRIFQDAMGETKKYVSDENFLEINYEDLCDKPVEKFKQAVDFCGLSWDSRFEKDIRSVRLRNSNYKWCEDLTEEQQDTLMQVLNAS